MAVTIRDIARMAQVSTATVSRYLNQPASVSKERGKRILEAINQSGYLPNELARGLTKNHSSIVGVVLPDINNMFFSAVMVGIEDQLEKSGYSMFICNTHGDIDKEKRFLNMLRAHRVSGIVALGTRPIDEAKNIHLYELAKNVPLVLAYDRFALNDDVSYIMTNEVQGMRDAVSYLYQEGHRRIAFINGNQQFTTYKYKQNGFLAACQDLGLDPEGMILEEDPYEAGGYEGMLKILKMDNRPTALVCANDQLAVGIIRAAFENGCNVPRDVSVIGFSNTPISGEIYPKLTTVDQFPFDTGRSAAKMLVDQIKSNNTKRSSLKINTKLVIRDSCMALDRK